MVITGSGGFAKQLIEVLAQQGELEHLCFFDSLNPPAEGGLFGFRVLRSLGEVSDFFRSTGDARFALGVGQPQARFRLMEEFTSIGGEAATLISPHARIGHFETVIGSGSAILTGSIIENSVQLGRGCLINLNCSIAHDTRIGDFTEIGPGANISGNCTIGEFSRLGTGVSVIPGITIGKYAVIGAGAVVTRDIPDHCMAAGVPATVRKNLSDNPDKVSA